MHLPVFTLFSIFMHDCYSISTYIILVLYYYIQYLHISYILSLFYYICYLYYISLYFIIFILLSLGYMVLCRMFIDISNIGIRIDCIPGRINIIYELIKLKGKLKGLCYELCGQYHSTMMVLGLII